MPEQVNWDYGEPIDALCQETAPNSQVFKREWTKATVEASSADPRFPRPQTHSNPRATSFSYADGLQLVDADDHDEVSASASEERAKCSFADGLQLVDADDHDEVSASAREERVKCSFASVGKSLRQFPPFSPSTTNYPKTVSMPSVTARRRE